MHQSYAKQTIKALEKSSIVFYNKDIKITAEIDTKSNLQYKALSKSGHVLCNCNIQNKENVRIRKCHI